MQSQNLSHLMSIWDFDFETGFCDSERPKNSQLPISVGVAALNERFLMPRSQGFERKPGTF
jgi:hypothetical protein